MTIVNDTIKKTMNTHYLSMEIEEVVKGISFMAGCKSYMSLNYIGEQFIDWTRG